MMDISERYSTEFFAVLFSLEKTESGLWDGEAVIRRKDTWEEVRGGSVKCGYDKDKIVTEICNKLDSISGFLTTRPTDWNSKIRKILAHYMDLSNRVTGFSFSLDDYEIKKGSDDVLNEMFFSFCRQHEHDIISLVKNIEDLTAEERKMLLSSDDIVYSDPVDPWHLDDLTARSEVIRYFINPSPDEIALNKRHNERLQAAVDQLEDDPEP